MPSLTALNISRWIKWPNRFITSVFLLLFLSPVSHGIWFDYVCIACTILYAEQSHRCMLGEFPGVWKMNGYNKMHRRQDKDINNTNEERREGS